MQQSTRTIQHLGAWCITYGKQHYNGYISRLKIHYVIFRQNGFEKIPRKVGKGFTKQKPHDAYGNSLIAVLQSNKDASPIYITSRWNHGSTADGTQGTEADHAYTTEEFLNIVGCDYSVLERAFEQWKSNVEKKAPSVDRKLLSKERIDALRQFKYVQMLINGGMSLKEVHDTYHLGFYSTQKIDDFSKEEKKMMGTYLVSMNCDGKNWMTLMDRRKMFFDQYFFQCNEVPRQYKGAQNEKLVSLKNPRKEFYVFDKVHHKFVDVDGAFKFKDMSSNLINSWVTELSNYYVLGVSSNQQALLDTRTMKLIKARNGSSSFEFIRKYGSIYYGNSCIDGVNGSILELTYDSSAGEVYYFDCATRSVH